MLPKKETFLWKRKTTAFWQKTRQKHSILAKSRHSQHSTKIMVSVISMFTYYPLSLVRLHTWVSPHIRSRCCTALWGSCLNDHRSQCHAGCAGRYFQTGPVFKQPHLIDTVLTLSAYCYISLQYSKTSTRVVTFLLIRWQQQINLFRYGFPMVVLCPPQQAMAAWLNGSVEATGTCGCRFYRWTNLSFLKYFVLMFV